jgi:hypothetical protein
MSTTKISSDALADQGTLTNGPAAAAILSAGLGCALVGILSFAGDASDAIGRMLNFYNPTGTLSGVTTVAIAGWLVAWALLNRAWQKQTVPMVRIMVGAFGLLAVGFVLTFPPAMDLLQGK